jgi:CubicO group peptidase (beta-lactamase class C family)
VQTSHQRDVPAPVGIDAAKLHALLVRARREIDDGLLPACQLAVAKDGHLIAFETYGDARANDRFLMYSSTKAFVAAAVWKLLSEGRLRVEQRVAELVPGFGANGKDGVTVEQVLLHTAGFPSAFLNPFDWTDEHKRHATFAGWPLEWEPGSRYLYHPLSSGWVQAELIERVTGRDFREYLYTEIVRPLGLESFRLGVPIAEQGDIKDVVLRGEPVTADELNAAWGIPEVPEGWLSQELLLFLNDPRVREVGIPAGGAVSTAADVAMFYQHLLANTGGLWNRDVVDRAIDRSNDMPDDLGVPTVRGWGIQVCGSPDGSGSFGWWYGFGRGNSARAFGHDGAGGQIAWANPETGVSFCYLTNGLDENILRQKRRLLAIGSRAAALTLSA